VSILPTGLHLRRVRLVAVGALLAAALAVPPVASAASPDVERFTGTSSGVATDACGLGADLSVASVIDFTVITLRDRQGSPTSVTLHEVGVSTFERLDTRKSVTERSAFTQFIDQTMNLWSTQGLASLIAGPGVRIVWAGRLVYENDARVFESGVNTSPDRLAAICAALA
jgi:hypothetical protein